MTLSLKKLSSWTALLLLLQIGTSSICSASSSASFSRSAHPFGLGVVLGEPTGLSAKYFFSQRRAVDMGLAYSFNSFVYIFGDYLFHFPGVFRSASTFVQQLTPYLGIGGVLLASTAGGQNNNKYFTQNGSTFGLGLRLPIGLEWTPAFPTLGIFVELVPGLGIVPSTFGFVEAGIGIRYFF